MEQIELDQTTRNLLDSIRHSRKTLCLFEMPADLAGAAVWEIGKVLLDHQGLPLVQYNTYRWYLRELAKLLRTRIGWDLALELELCLRKWVGFCLDAAMLQALLRECYGRIGAMTPDEIEENPKHEVRMRNEARNPNAPPRKHERHEGDVETAKNAKVRTRTPADDADSADCVSVTGTINDEPCTKSEPTTAGAGNG
jgi:hypothetical protein